MEFAEKLLTNNVAFLGIGAAAVLAGVIFLVFRISPGPNYEEVFRKQREQLMAMDEPKPKKKEKTSKKKEKKSSDKKDQQQQSGSPADEVAKHDHVDFCEKKQVKVVMLDEPPQVEPEKVLAPSRQPVKPILIHPEEEDRSAVLPETTTDQHSAIVRSNSFRESKPKDEVELHHKKQQASPAKAPTAKVAPITVSQPKQQEDNAKGGPQSAAQKKPLIKTDAPEQHNSSKKNSPVHEKKERKIFSKKELKELVNQIEQGELPADMGEETVQRLVDALLNFQNESKEWKSNRQDPMQTLRKKLLEKEELVVNLQSGLDNALARIKELHQESQSWKTKFSQVQTVYTQKEEHYKEEVLRAQRDQHQAENQLKHIEAYNETVRGRLQQLEASARAADQRFASELRAAEEAAATKLNELREVVESFKTQLEQVASDKNGLESDKRQIEAQLKRTEAELSQAKKAVTDAQVEIDSLKKQLSGVQSASQDSGRLAEEIVSLKEEISQLKTRSEALHKKNWIAVESMSQAEASLRELQSKKAEDEQKTRKTLVEALPKGAAKDLKDLEGDEFVKSFVQQLKLQSKEVDKLKAEIASLQKSLSEAQEAAAKSAVAAETAAAAAATAVIPETAVPLNSSAVNDTRNDEEVDQLREEVYRLRGEVAHRSAVLNETEKLLKILQENVEEEEHKWHEDRKRFESEKTEMSAACRDLESKLKELQTQLEDVETERSSTINELDDTKATLDKLNQQLAEAQQAVTPSQQTQQNGHQSEESTAASPTPSAQQNGGGHDGDGVEGGDAGRAAQKKNKKKKKAKKVS